MKILVYTENFGGVFKKTSFELLSFASHLAEKETGEVVALSFGPTQPGELEKLAQHGADSVMVSHSVPSHLDNQSYTDLIRLAFEQSGSACILFINNFTGKALAPRLAARLGLGMVSGVNTVPQTSGQFTKAVFSGKALAQVGIRTTGGIVTVNPNTIPPRLNPKPLQVVELAPAGGTPATHLVSENSTSTGKILLTDADIVVSGGRGMKGPENWAPLEELATLLGAATACSRPVADEGWRPHHEHVGQTGLMVSPNLYLAFGISGAIQHLAGISGSKVIVAVNKDHEAPIFEAAAYGIIGDVQQVLPQLIEEIRAFKSH